LYNNSEEEKRMAKNDSTVVEVKIQISLWDAFKLRLAGKEFRKMMLNVVAEENSDD
jgi:hypothetical protein